MPKKQRIQRDWMSKSLALAFPGLALAFLLSALFASLTPAGVPGTATQVQLTMWVVPVLWTGIAGFGFLFRSGLRAWIWLGSACLICFGLILLIHQLRDFV